MFYNHTTIIQTPVTVMIQYPIVESRVCTSICLTLNFRLRARVISGVSPSPQSEFVLETSGVPPGDLNTGTVRMELSDCEWIK